LRPLVPALLLVVPLVGAPHLAIAAAPKPERKVSAVSLLPDGSELQRVMFPRYDAELRLAGLLRSEAMTLVDDQTLAGRAITIEFFNPDRSPRGRIDLGQAVLDQRKGLVESREPVTLRSDRVNANGRGLFYDIELGRGLLLGPTMTWLPATSSTAMNSRSRPFRAAGLAGAALIAQAAAAPASKEGPPADPAPATPAAEVAPAQDAAATAKARRDLGVALDASNAANAAAKAFLEKADLADDDGAAPEAPAARPLETQPGPTDTVVECDGGMYFDPDQGVFVFLKNVRISDPRFSMSGANELKIFLGKKASAPSAKGAAPKVAGGAVTERFDDVERIIATGAIVIDQKAAEGRESIKASGALFHYNVKDDLVILSGGYPWVVQGGIALRAKQRDLTLRISPKACRFETEGNWQTFLPLDQMRQRKP
jgi:lipopolysaccharide export system protein LptA